MDGINHLPPIQSPAYIGLVPVQTEVVPWVNSNCPQEQKRLIHLSEYAKNGIYRMYHDIQFNVQCSTQVDIYSHSPEPRFNMMTCIKCW